VNRLHFLGTAVATIVEFCTQVDYVKFQHTDEKSPLNVAHPMISLKRLKLECQILLIDIES